MAVRVPDDSDDAAKVLCVRRESTPMAGGRGQRLWTPWVIVLLAGIQLALAPPLIAQDVHIEIPECYVEGTVAMLADESQAQEPFIRNGERELKHRCWSFKEGVLVRFRTPSDGGARRWRPGGRAMVGLSFFRRTATSGGSSATPIATSGGRRRSRSCRMDWV